MKTIREVGIDSRGYTLFVEEDKVGDRRYWSNASAISSFFIFDFNWLECMGEEVELALEDGAETVIAGKPSEQDTRLRA